MHATTDLFDALPADLQAPLRVRWQQFDEALPPGTRLADAVLASLPKVWASSDYVLQQCLRQPALLPELARADLLARYEPEQLASRVADALAGVADEATLHRTLRQLRRREMVRIMWRDIAGWADLTETMADLSDLAGACIEGALARLYAWQCASHGTPRDAQGDAMQMVVLGMGKLGAWELNVSSDIDLIFSYAAEGETDGARALSHSEFFTRLGRKLIAALDQVTADGFVFRVDMRLRPFGDSGPLVSSFAAMENYYQIHGREWERYAMVKARVVAGDRQAGAQLMELLRPFVYRRYLDFGAYQALREMKALISQEVRRKGMEHNVKLGAGGIREIEFIGQLFQLIRGGRDPKLQARKILKVLPYLAAAGYLPDFVVQELMAAYRFLRTVEHRLQEFADQQTHLLPVDEAGRARLAFSLDYPDWPALERELSQHRQRVQSRFEQVFEAPQSEAGGDIETGSAVEAEPDLAGVWQGSLDEAAACAVLQEHGYQDAAGLWQHLAALRQSRAYGALSAAARERLDRLMPLLLGAAARADDPDITVRRLLELVMHIAPRSVYLALLVENPLALSQLVRLTSASAWISQYLKQYPLLLDELLDPRSLYRPPDRAELAAELARRMAGLDPEDQELAMDQLRQFRHANVLRVAAADIVGALPVMKVSDHLTWIAETVLEEALQLAWQHLRERHGTPPQVGEDKGFAIIGYGKLGGIELGYGSDLDLVFLYGAGDGQAMTTGPAPLAVQVFYARLGQRLIHVLTAYTPAGSAYEVDMRLRPDGASGLLVSSLQSFEAYQQGKAWLWEHQALVRARPVAGDPAIGAGFEAVRRRVLGRPREVATVREGILEMRRKMRSELDRSTDTRFDLKQGAGGMVDIEFLVQFAVLVHAHAHPALLDYTDNVRLLDTLAREALYPAREVEVLGDAYRVYRAATHRRALQQESSVVDAEPYLHLREQVQAIWRNWLEIGDA